jgi:hypothetical protein
LFFIVGGPDQKAGFLRPLFKAVLLIQEIATNTVKVAPVLL